MLTVSFAVIFILFASVLLRGSSESSSFSWVAKSFLAAYSLMILVGYVVLIAIPQIYGKRLIFCAILMALILCIVKRRKTAFEFCRCVKEFMLPSSVHQYAFCDASGALNNTRYFLIIASSFSLVLYGIMAASPVNWDSNTYNIARTMLFTVQGTIMPQSVGSLRQVLYEFGHDILYWPDLCFYNLRGLGLLSSVEFIVLLGTLQHVVITLWNGFFLGKYAGGKPDASGKAVQYSLIAVIVLILCSSQQVMQGVITKNDLIIVVLLMLSVGCALELNNVLYLNMINMKSSYLVVDFIAPQVLAFSIACSSKSYGPIVGIPLLASLLINILYFTGSSIKSTLKCTLQAADTSLLALSAVIGTVSGATLSLSRLRYSYDEAAVSLVTSVWTLHDLAFSDRVKAFLLNLARVVYQLFLFPFSTFKNGLWVPDIFKSKFATGGGTSFSLIEYHSHDSAYPSWIVLSLLVICLTISFYLILCRRDRLRKYFLSKPVSISLGLLLITSLLSTVVIFWSIAYQPWISRFLGCIYIPLFPIMAYQLGILLTSMRGFVPGHFAGLLCLNIVAMVAVGNFTNSLNQVDGQVAMTRLMSTSNNDALSSYKAHVASKGFTSAEIEYFIEDLRTAKYESLVLCDDGDSWNLIPVMYASLNKSYNGTNLSTEKSSLCPTGKKGVLTKPSNGITYVILP
jgi:hypothetical protein